MHPDNIDSHRRRKKVIAYIIQHNIVDVVERMKIQRWSVLNGWMDIDSALKVFEVVPRKVKCKELDPFDTLNL